MHVSSEMARRGGALLAALAGAMNIASALYPGIPARMEIVRDILPVYLIHSAQTATVLAGFLLVLLADGLRKRRRRAMHLTVLVLALSCVFHLLKGLDVEEAAVAAGLAGALLACRHAFCVPSRLPAPRHALQRIGTFALLYYSYLLAGFLILRRDFTPHPTPAGIVQAPFDLLLETPLYRALTPHAQWFERSIIIVGSLALLLSLVQLLRPLIPERAAGADDVARARRLIERYGGDTLSYFALQDGRSYFFDETGEAVLSYRLWDTVALVGGDPIGRTDRLGPLLRAFLAYCDENGMEPCLLGVSGRHLHEYAAAGLRTLKIGEEAVIALQHFDQTKLKRKVRRAIRHIGELGITADVYSAAGIPQPIRQQMSEIAQQWVQIKGGAERGFSMTLGRLPRPAETDCTVIVARDGERIWGYLSLVPVYQASAWSLDAMRRRPDSPNGLTEFMIAAAAGHFAAHGFRELSLNFATLSNAENDISSRALESTRRFLFENLSSFYQLKSLYQFNSKFEPEWRSRYMAYRAVHKIPRLALAIVQSEDPIRLPAFVSALWR